MLKMITIHQNCAQNALEKNNFYYSKLISLYQGGPKRSAGKKTLQKPHRWGFYVVFDIIRGPAKRGGLFC